MKQRPELVFVDVGGVFHLPRMEKVTPAFAALGYRVDDRRQLFRAQPGAALACPYCDGLVGFDAAGQAQAALSGWPRAA